VKAALAVLEPRGEIISVPPINSKRIDGSESEKAVSESNQIPFKDHHPYHTQAEYSIVSKKRPLTSETKEQFNWL
jgi:hypothetical protein